jgi:phosphoribosylanthranilate isomerase
LQQLTIILTFVCVSMNQDRAIIRRLHSKLSDTVQISFLEIQDVLRELAASIEVEPETEAGSEEKKSSEEKNDLVEERAEQERRKEQRQLLIEWSACLAALESESNE